MSYSQQYSDKAFEKPAEVTKWRGEYFLPGLPWFERHNLIGYFLSNEISSDDTDNRAK